MVFETIPYHIKWNIKSPLYQPSRKVTLHLHQVEKTSPASNKITERTAKPK
jgi:hypothetical protein